MTPLQEEALRIIVNDRPRAHETLFAHRHPHTSPAAHAQVITAFHSTHPRVVVEAFRGFAKSTTGEETIIVAAALGEVHNVLIIGASYERACERLESIGHEVETNETLEQVFGQLRGSTTWTESRKILSTGVVLQAKGAGQSLRGVKHHELRPDFVLIDDLEDEESTRTPTARQEMLRWLYKTLIPALAQGARIRFIGNRLDPEAVIVKISKDPVWQHFRFPIMYQDPATAEDVATWPELFPLEWIYAKREEMRRLGLLEDFNQEYMCEADAPEEKVFRAEHFTAVTQPRVRTWEATWAMVDPARSVGKRSATTAIPIWSWVANRLVVWDCRIGHWLPDEIIANMLEVDTEYRPVAIGVEEDALNQFILQPLRQAQVRHGHPLPIRPMAAKRYTEGRGKLDFIKSLQPFFAAGEVVFAKPLPALVEQFKSFPKGYIDGPNALAYALKMRPGAALYEDFTQANVVEEAGFAHHQLYLAMNATKSCTTAVLCQYDGVTLSVIADDVDEGDPGQIAGAVVRRAQLNAIGRTMKIVAPPSHFDTWANVGLQAAVARIPAEIVRGGDVGQGQEEIRRLFRGSVRGMPAVQVGYAARWTLNAFSGGYARAFRKGGGLSNEAEDNIYRTLMEGLESFAGLLKVETSMADTGGEGWTTNASGVRYRSALRR